MKKRNKNENENERKNKEEIHLEEVKDDENENSSENEEDWRTWLYDGEWIIGIGNDDEMVIKWIKFGAGSRVPSR